MVAGQNAASHAVVGSAVAQPLTVHAVVELLLIIGDRAAQDGPVSIPLLHIFVSSCEGKGSI